MEVTYLVHGFNVKDDGDSTINKVEPFLLADATHEYTKWKYGWFGLLSVLFKNKKVAKKIARNMNKRHSACTNAIGHSNGCAILVETAKRAKIETLILINPALKVDTKFPASIGKIICFYTKHDKPTKTAAFFDRVPVIQLIIPNAWGKMGAKGYAGPDGRVQNINMSADVGGHSEIFKDQNIQKYGEMIRGILYANR